MLLIFIHKDKVMGQLKRREEERLSVQKRCENCFLPVHVDDLEDGVCSSCNHRRQKMEDE